MTKRTLIIVIIGLVVFAGAAVTIASSIGSSHDSQSMPAGQHQMNNGTTMQGDHMNGK